MQTFKWKYIVVIKTGCFRCFPRNNKISGIQRPTLIKIKRICQTAYSNFTLYAIRFSIPLAPSLTSAFVVSSCDVSAVELQLLSSCGCWSLLIPLQRGRQLWGDAGYQSHHLPSRSGGVEASSHIQVLVWNWCWIFSFWRANLRTEIW